MTILIIHEAGALQTSGLKRLNHAEIRLRVDESHLSGEGESLLRYVADYIISSGESIRPSETLLYGYWLLKFDQGSDGERDVWEQAAEATHFVEGANLALRYWREQHDVCDRAGMKFEPPRPDQLVVVSKGVLEGGVVKGVRYPSPEHMSGWWLVTDQYDGEVRSMRNEHLYHLTALRPDLARYVALPFGSRFDLSNGEDVWFDSDIQEP